MLDRRVVLNRRTVGRDHTFVLQLPLLFYQALAHPSGACAQLCRRICIFPSPHSFRRHVFSTRFLRVRRERESKELSRACRAPVVLAFIHGIWRPDERPPLGHCWGRNSLEIEGDLEPFFVHRAQLFAPLYHLCGIPFLSFAHVPFSLNRGQ